MRILWRGNLLLCYRKGFYVTAFVVFKRVIAARVGNKRSLVFARVDGFFRRTVILVLVRVDYRNFIVRVRRVLVDSRVPLAVLAVRVGTEVINLILCVGGQRRAVRL